MDPNELFKSALFEQAPKVKSSVDALMAGLGKAGQTVAQDAGFLSGLINEPRNSWIGMNPIGKAVTGGLSLVGMLSSGGGRASLSPLMAQLLARGEELAGLEKKIRQTPDVFGFESASAWRKSLPQADLFALDAHNNTAQKLARQSIKQESMLGRDVPLSMDEYQRLRGVAQFPGQESSAMYALGLNPATFKKVKPPTEP